MPVSSPQMISFAGGVRANDASSSVGETAVVTATNIDFSREPGAAAVRAGSQVVYSPNTGIVRHLFKHYKNNLGASLLYAQSGTTIHKITSDGTISTVGTNGSTDRTAFTAYKEFVYWMGSAGSGGQKDDGTTTTEWIKQAPTAAPAIAVATLAPLVVGTEFWAGEGVMVGTATLTGTATCSVTTSPWRLQINAVVLNTNLNENGGNVIDDYGLDSLEIAFSDPAAVVKISRDYSIGNGEFTNYFHTELDMDIAEDVWPNIERLVDPQIAEGTSTTNNIDIDDRQDMVSEGRQDVRSPQTAISAAKDTFNAWVVARPEFQLISKDTTPDGWANIGAVRIVVEATRAVTVKVCNWQITGARTYPLNDADIGYAYAETFCTIDANGGLTGESAPSPITARTKVQSAQILATSTNTATGNHGITHRIFYRQGGYLRDFYAVATLGLNTATFTDSLTDIQVLSLRKRMPRNIYSKTTFPNNVVVASEPHYQRLFIAHENRLRWSLPGQPDTFSSDNEAVISHAGDEVYGLIVWPPGMIIINRDSVYEMDGSVFEGRASNWILRRTGAKHGSKASRTCIKTPYGIPLVENDGLYMYMPGQGVDLPIPWVSEHIGDAWKGGGTADQAAIKGNRIPAINRGYLRNSCAEYYDNKLYLAMPTGTATEPNTVFILNFATQQVWWYQYPFEITSLLWDFADSRLLAGTPAGVIMQIEHSQQDQTTAGTASPITYSMRTRPWTTPSDTIVENFALDARGGGHVVQAIYDGTATVTSGTHTGSARRWSILPLNGTVARQAEFVISGTQANGTQNTIYALKYDALIEPQRITYWRSEHSVAGAEGEKIWDLHHADIEAIGTGSVLATVYVDNTAVMTNTITSPTNGRVVRRKSFPADTYGNVGYTVYNTSTQGVVFKLWPTPEFSARPEPPRVSVWKTEVQSLDENICDAFDVDINPNGTVTGVCYVDNTAVATGTFVGAARQSYTWALPNEVYGRTIYAIYTGDAFKHYQTWWHLRPEPDRWTNFVSDRISGNEKEWKSFEADINPLGATVLATVVLDGTALATYTISGFTERRSVVFSLPADRYGRTIYAIYNVSGGMKFKHYNTWFEGQDEPDQHTSWHVGPLTWPSPSTPRTWVAELNPQGTCTGTLLVNGTAISTATFTGTRRQVFNVGVDFSSGLTISDDARGIDIYYNGATPFKHYDSNVEVEAMPFYKTSWVIHYTKLGGATQLDMLRFWQYDIEPVSGTATITSIWDIDGTSTHTQTHTVAGRSYRDRIAFPPGCRGYIFQQRLLSNTPIHVHGIKLDIDRAGVKGFSRIGITGTPNG